MGSTVLGFLLAFGAGQDDSPYPIYFDKPSYSWTDKVGITIIAPSWNSNRHSIDTIGGDEGHSIRIATRGHSIEPYKLTETGPNSGIFTGEVILTGFLHDVDGDGDFDVFPKTAGTGPTNGFLETRRDDAVSISFEFTENRVATETALINWNIGRVEFQRENYDADEHAIIRLHDPDMNLNPEAVDSLEVDVFSDSDSTGIRADAIEVSQDAGLFEAKVSFTQKRSGGGQLYANPGDHITAKYDDHTLPPPYGKSDSLKLEAHTVLGSAAPLGRVSLGGISASDSLGNAVSSINAGDQIQIVGNMKNLQDFEQSFVFVFQISDERGAIVFLSWIQGGLDALQTLDVSQSWVPSAGGHTVEVFVWDSLASPVPLAPPKTESYIIGE